jgi:hypothetical protein
MRAKRGVSTWSQGGFLLPIVLFSSAAILIFVTAAYSQVMRQIDDVRRLAANGEFAIAKVSAKAEIVYRFMSEPKTVFGLGLLPGTALRVDNRPYSLPSAGVYVRVQDAAGLIDANRADLNVWRRLAEFVGVPTDQRDVLADRILDFIDEDNFRRLNGAERDDYVAAQREPPPNRPLESALSLQSVLGWEALLPKAMSEQFIGALTVGATGRVNPNAASPAVLFATLGVPLVAAKDLVAQRGEGFLDASYVARFSTMSPELLAFAVDPVTSPVLLLTVTHVSTGRTERVRVTITPRASRWPWTADFYETLPAADVAELAKRSMPLPLPEAR